MATVFELTNETDDVMDILGKKFKAQLMTVSEIEAMQDTLQGPGRNIVDRQIEVVANCLNRRAISQNDKISKEYLKENLTQLKITEILNFMQRRGKYSPNYVPEQELEGSVKAETPPETDSPELDEGEDGEDTEVKK